jgi:hypothetical protein
MERERDKWKEAVRIASEYPVPIEDVRSGLDYLWERASDDGLEMSETDAERIVRASLDNALATREPHPQYGVFYNLWKDGKS